MKFDHRTNKEKVKECFINKLIQVVSSDFRSYLLLILTPKHSYSYYNDIDIFMIFNDSNSKDDPWNIKKYIELVKAIKIIEHNISKNFKICLVDFSTFRIEEYHIGLISQQLQKDVLGLHLLIYPSLQSFFMWENHSVIMSIITHSKILYGDPFVLRHIKNSLLKRSLNERIQPLLSLLMETYRNIKLYFKPDKLVSTILIKEGIRKLKYVIKYSLWEFGMEEFNMIPPTSYEELFKLASEIKILKPLIEVAKELRKFNQKNISLEELELLYEKTMLILQRIIYIYIEREKIE